MAGRNAKIELTDGTEVFLKLGMHVWGELQRLKTSGKVFDGLVLVELVAACREPSKYRVGEMCRRKLAELDIVDSVDVKTGVASIPDEVRAVVSVAARGEAKRGKITLVSPFKAGRCR